MKNVNIHGAKNSALPILAATLLKKNLYYIRNIPLVSDINVQIDILKQFNVKVWHINKKNLLIDTTCLIIPRVIDYSKNTRGTYYFIGSTVMYDNDLEYTLETGCKIDVRHIDYHITLLELLGKQVTFNENKLLVKGSSINRDITYTLPKPSIGATLNGIFMFSKCKSVVTLKNYAKDPYIINTINLLKKMGICIDYDDDCVTINGINKHTKNIENKLIDHSIIEDPIEALTYVIYSGINLKEYSISEYTIGPINIYNLGDAYSLLQSIGIFLVESRKEGFYHVKKTKLMSFNVSTYYFPKIYTDIQPFLTLLSLFITNGVTTIREQIWNDRFKYIYEFNKFKYNIVQNEDTIIIDHSHKVNEINDTDKSTCYDTQEFNCTDLRGGMALLLLMRKNNIQKDPNNKKYIDRGYYDYENNIKVILCSKEQYYTSYSTKELSNINIGGVSKYYTEVFSETDIINTVTYCKNNNISYKMIGDGNNIYFSEYYNGMIIKNTYSGIYYDCVNDEFTVSSGTSLIDFILYVAEKGYDLSSLAGIPGTIGGAVYGNAGAYGLEIKDIITSCMVMINSSDIIIINNKCANFEYRNSIFKKQNNSKQNNNNIIIISVKIKIKQLDTGNDTVDKIKTNIKNIIMLRNTKFNMENTLGSVFKNITINDKKIYAWELIDELNIRGCTINNIIIHNTHPNIFINNGCASPSDLNILIEYIINYILKTKNITLEKEIEYINL